jgi:hypothetical protein
MPAGPAITSAPADMTAHHRLVLSRLADAGLAIALDLQAQIHATTPPTLDPAGPSPHPLDLIPPHELLALARANADLALAFARVSRAVRLSIALYDRLAKGEAGPPREARGACAPGGAVVVGPAADAEPEADDAEGLAHALHERLFEHEFPEALLNRPVSDLIAQICADLGLSLPLAGRVADAKRQTGGVAPSSGALQAPTSTGADRLSLTGAPPSVQPQDPP